ncbi:hypothetical protein EVAR_149_1 [Eumeta japonica]|uniref:Uncharacterized protein n=1 Tax=Eumeta variegata TaxID=151549 RepID=A0A4C1S9L0_EUMVA|nr:hypothetical protein EVAR_149_1 [Eumeta japonica]
MSLPMKEPLRMSVTISQQIIIASLRAADMIENKIPTSKHGCGHLPHGGGAIGRRREILGLGPVAPRSDSARVGGRDDRQSETIAQLRLS